MKQSWISLLAFCLTIALVSGVVVAEDETVETPVGMVLIPAGSFQMGDAFNEGHPSERPVHTVYVSAFYMAKYEVTKALWDEVAVWAEANGYDIGPADGWGLSPDRPVSKITWSMTVKWCNARSEKEGLTPCYTVDGSVYRSGASVPDCNWTASGYRLPTEAEWEKAARGGCEGRRFAWCDTDMITHSRANYYSSDEHSYDTSPTRGFNPAFSRWAGSYVGPVGSLEPNGYGLYDMAGNVWEFCWDWYSDDYYATSPERDPRGPASGWNRVMRGGSWRGQANGDLRVSIRLPRPTFLSFDTVGFRLAMAAP